jgi:hypothetical protein
MAPRADRRTHDLAVEELVVLVIWTERTMVVFGNGDRLRHTPLHEELPLRPEATRLARS